MINKARILKNFTKLISIDSPSGREKEVADYLVECLKQEGLKVTLDHQAAISAGYCTGNVIGRLQGSLKNVPPILFACHMDTVMPGEGIKLIEKEGILYSDGTTILGADDKSGIAAVLEALTHIREAGIAHGEIEVLFSFGEEVGLLGAKHLDYGLLKSKQAYVLDSGGDPGTIINQGPAQKEIKAVIRGKAAHAGVNPEAGISAIRVAARAIDRMKLQRIDEETTANIGIIQGGTATNIVCPSVELQGEARSLSNDKLTYQSVHMEAVIREACVHYGAGLEFHCASMYEAFYIDEEDQLVIWAKMAADKLGLPPIVTSSGGGSDTNIFNTQGIQAVNLGTGMSKVHGTEEYIRIAHLVQTADWIAKIIEVVAQDKA